MGTPAGSTALLQDPVVPPTGPARVKLVLVLGALIALGPLTIDMYLPALPSITTDLLTTAATVQLTLTGTLVGLALGQLVVGPLADAFGRKRPLLIGAGVHVLASVLCALAPNIALLGTARVLQGAGAAAGAVVAMAIVRDLYTGRAAAILLSRLILVMGAAPIVAPTLGGELLRFTSWRGVFVALALYGLVLVPVAARLLPETLPPHRRRAPRPAAVARTYAALLRDRTFVGLVLVAGLAMSSMFAYISGSSFVFQQQYGLDEQQFGLLFGAGAFFVIGATQVNAYLLRWFEPRQLLLAAVASGSAAGVAVLLVAATGFGGLLGLLVPLWATMTSVGVALPNSPALALDRSSLALVGSSAGPAVSDAGLASSPRSHGEAAGTAAALLGAVQFGTGAVVSPAVGVLGNDAVAMGAVMAVTMALSLAVLLVVVRPWRLADLDAPVP